jgi:hypothetical protein
MDIGSRNGTLHQPYILSDQLEKLRYQWIGCVV